ASEVIGHDRERRWSNRESAAVDSNLVFPQMAVRIVQCSNDLVIAYGAGGSGRCGVGDGDGFIARQPGDSSGELRVRVTIKSGCVHRGYHKLRLGKRRCGCGLGLSGHGNSQHGKKNGHAECYGFKACPLASGQKRGRDVHSVHMFLPNVSAETETTRIVTASREKRLFCRAEGRLARKWLRDLSPEGGVSLVPEISLVQ